MSAPDSFASFCSLYISNRSHPFVFFLYCVCSIAEIFWDDLKHARRIYQKRAILEDDSESPVSARGLQGPGVVTNAVQNVKGIITRRLSNENEGATQNDASAVTKLDNNVSAN